MIDLFLEIIDRLIQLKQYRNQKLRTMFDELIDPIFNDLLLVHRDYVDLFEGTLNILPRGVPSSDNATKYLASTEKAAEYLHNKRMKFEPVRIK
ncbi:hypothetical protein [Kaarinaea lacus]